MARLSKLVISESIEELKSLLKKQKQYKNTLRLQALISIKENKFQTRKELSEDIGVVRRTLEMWLSKYRQGGIGQMLISPTRNRKSTFISAEVEIELDKIVQDPEQGFSSYVEAQQWLRREYSLDLKYNTVREHLIRRYKTKIKSPRKSHVKKDDKAVDAFLKTT